MQLSLNLANIAAARFESHSDSSKEDCGDVRFFSDVIVIQVAPHFRRSFSGSFSIISRETVTSLAIVSMARAVPP